MRKILFILLSVLPLYLVFNFLFLDRVAFLSPIEYPGDIVVRCDSRGNGFFGAGRNGKRTHQGIDLYAATGKPVRASRSGRVVAAKRNPGMGNYVVIRHSDSMVTIYGHLLRLHVRKGQFVRQGQLIGEVGKTGNANYHAIMPHLHFEVRVSGKPQDPLQYLE